MKPSPFESNSRNSALALPGKRVILTASTNSPMLMSPFPEWSRLAKAFSHEGYLDNKSRPNARSCLEGSLTPATFFVFEGLAASPSFAPGGSRTEAIDQGKERAADGSAWVALLPSTALVRACARRGPAAIGVLAPALKVAVVWNSFSATSSSASEPTVEATSEYCVKTSSPSLAASSAIDTVTFGADLARVSVRKVFMEARVTPAGIERLAVGSSPARHWSSEARRKVASRGFSFGSLWGAANSSNVMRPSSSLSISLKICNIRLLKSQRCSQNARYGLHRGPVMVEKIL
mmetsp:Transcript_85239/g.182684  ORF Transcript_85239/g.182684 Transcript_85239/m.182684 type:complete len:291 (-) Transcript_85239:597-1469(-)